MCVGGKCTCARPWAGPGCGRLTFAAASPAAGRDLYPATDVDHNTWNGPIVTEQVAGPSGNESVAYHMYLPLYPKGELYHPVALMHGTAPSVYGPWQWRNLSGVEVGINPGALVFNSTTTGKPVFSLWVSGQIYVADAPSGPFSNVTLSGNGTDGCSINPSPLIHGGAFFCMGQKGTDVWTAPALQGPWTLHAEIGDAKEGGGEDPFLWVDARGHWHVLYHAADPSQRAHCATSRVSSHVFSADGGVTWHSLVPPVSPYEPAVTWADGNQSYSTMERPHAYFDATGRMTHLGVAAPLNIGDEGCESMPCGPKHRTGGQCPCVNCKYASHAGTLLIELA